MRAAFIIADVDQRQTISIYGATLPRTRRDAALFDGGSKRDWPPSVWVCAAPERLRLRGSGVTSNTSLWLSKRSSAVCQITRCLRVNAGLRRVCWNARVFSGSICRSYGAEFRVRGFSTNMPPLTGFGGWSRATRSNAIESSADRNQTTKSKVQCLGSWVDRAAEV